MALPPEQINIKRRREEEPVDTLYIQSELHQKKRRFTDFVFQRVTVSAGATTQSQGPHVASPQRTSKVPDSSSLSVPKNVRSPRAVSSYSSLGGVAGAQVPRVRATSPGAEFREERRRLAVQKETQQRLQDAIFSGPSPVPLPPGAPAGKTRQPDAQALKKTDETETSGTSSPRAGAGKIRHFHLEKPKHGHSASLSTLSGGIQKRRTDRRPVLVEKLARAPTLKRTASIRGQIRPGTSRSADDDASLQQLEAEIEMHLHGASEPAVSRSPRKRPVMGAAERRWREEQKATHSAAKTHLVERERSERTGQSAHDDPSKWDLESDQLARELQEIALEMTGDSADVLEDDRHESRESTKSSFAAANVNVPKPALKYQPRTPKRMTPRNRVGESTAQHELQEKQHSGAAQDADVMETDHAPKAAGGEKKEAQRDGPDRDSDSDGDYVYDTYVRLPLGSATSRDGHNVHELFDPAAGIVGVPHGVGVVVITEEDEKEWAIYAEDEEREWDSEDEDSNAEDNPANDYPDEDLAFDDEFDDPSAVYHRFRDQGASDDEEFDPDFDYEVDERARRGLAWGGDSDSEVEKDVRPRW